MMTRVPVSVVEEPARRARPPVQVRLRRRRRTAATLVAAFGVLVAVAAVTGAVVPAVLAAVAGVLGVAYATVVLRLRRLATEREMALAFVDESSFDWARFEAELQAERLTADGDDQDAPASVDLGDGDLVRFLGAYLLGWVLTPLAVLLRLAGGRLDLRAHPVLAKLVELQEAGRSQSLRLLAAGVVATAGVGAVGSLAAPAVASASPVISTSATVHYTVQAGDTLGRVAARFGTTVGALASANGIGDVNLILVGQVLTIPGAGTDSAAPAASGSYTVREGDTLARIAARLGTTAGALASANHLADPNLILVGEVLHVPGGGGSLTPANAPAESDSPSTVTTAAVSSSPSTYRVQAGDTLATIATRFGTTVANLAGLNRISNPNLIYVGELLRVSGTAPARHTVAATVAVETPTAPSTPASPPAPSTSSSGESAAAATAVRVALQQVGVPYVWGGESRQGFDCSGLVTYAYAAAGVSLAHYSVSQYQETTRISESQLLPGDLVFYDTGSGAQPGHVAMYIGNGMVVAANDPGTAVQTQSITYDGTPMGFGRVG
ncbi:MAG TPA: LysM peptidoglycan-binding domain-containing protein [Acidimicrobiales bacterium]|nr:LysM peptidoglycan-binding domain-containing protein [Acidimicrobiales bacterium]